MGERATETAFKSLNKAGRLANYRVIHFATHGLVSGDLHGVSEPALLLTPPDTATPEDDGLLTASEVSQTKLDANWVVLSACNTGAEVRRARRHYRGRESLLLRGSRPPSCYALGNR